MTRDRGLHTMLGVCAAILVLAALYLTRPIFAPVAFALFIIAIVWPFQRALQLRMPKLPALAVTLLVTVVVLSALGSMVVRGFGRAGQWLIGNAARFQTLYVEIAGWLEQHGVYVANLLVESFNVAWIVGMVREVSGRLQTLLSFAMAFALNYIPFIGPLFATVFPTLFALAQFESWQMAVVIFLCLNLSQFLLGSYLEPRVAGAALSLSPFMVLFAVFFWSFLWGIPGAFIGVPIMIALHTLCEQSRSGRWLAVVLSGRAGGAR